MTQLALFLYWPCLLATGNRVLMAAYTARMKGCFSLWCSSFICFFIFMLMTFVARLHHGIVRLMLVMACVALSNAETSVFLVCESNSTYPGFKLYNHFILRNRQARCRQAMTVKQAIKLLALPQIVWVTFTLPLPQDKEPILQDESRLHWKTAFCFGNLCCVP